MKLIYLHGLDSSPNASKALITKTHAEQQGIQIDIPNLNCPPNDVLQKIQDLLTQDTVLVGSSLGGYFASLISDMTGTPAVLLNPSIRPDVSFRRFLADKSLQNVNHDSVIYVTTGGWHIKASDLEWFEHNLLMIKNPAKQAVLLSMDDELLDANATKEFYQSKGVAIYSKTTGGHRMMDYDERVVQVLETAKQFV